MPEPDTAVLRLSRQVQGRKLDEEVSGTVDVTPYSLPTLGPLTTKSGGLRKNFRDRCLMPKRTAFTLYLIS